jgi:hypothetical protein
VNNLLRNLSLHRKTGFQNHKHKLSQKFLKLKSFMTATGHELQPCYSTTQWTFAIWSFSVLMMVKLTLTWFSCLIRLGFTTKEGKVAEHKLRLITYGSTAWFKNYCMVRCELREQVDWVSARTQTKHHGWMVNTPA